ncbi:MAG: hypothetical protein M3494_13540 [Actinomycetota bacterium]|jgi:hypothetical protein|nr:hypothetical protein [Rubrobacter sp.]MDQ3509013.1 hypothetical protein [Actinomycetota bacterium]
MSAFETLRGRVVAGTLVLALLLCHGVFGSMHLAHGPLAAPPAETESGAHAHANHHGGHETIVAHGDGGSVSHHGMAPEYFAVFVALLFGAVFLLLRSKMRVFAWKASFRSKVLPRPAVFRAPATGPTLPRLQVFRL